MNEKEFWLYLDTKLAQGAMPQVSGYIDSPSGGMNASGKYCGGHSVLFNGHDNLPKSVIVDIGELVFNQRVSLEAKEAILMILAHHPTKTALNILKRYKNSPDYQLRFFAELAYEECCMWNE